MSVKVNGKMENVEGKTVVELIENMGLKSSSLIVEYNYNILKSDKWEETVLQADDNLELLSFVGGG